jgi:aldehyde:ferredoxin oxidoreductase
MLGVSERIWNLTRAFWVREIPGFGRAWDHPPPRFSSEPVPDGPNAGYFLSKEKLDQLLDWYYEARGWDADGIPTRQTLLRLGLPEAAEAVRGEQ